MFQLDIVKKWQNLTKSILNIYFRIRNHSKNHGSEDESTFMEHIVESEMIAYESAIIPMLFTTLNLQSM